MSYNSNGYIMLDFSMLDFSRTNQIIDGIYERVFEIVGTNKFVLILNAQSKTPLPACVSFINSSYVIESFLYNFSITMDDNVRIENVSSDLIKDGIISAGTTWSSSKINYALQNIPSPITIDAVDKNVNMNLITALQDAIVYEFSDDCLVNINSIIRLDSNYVGKIQLLLNDVLLTEQSTIYQSYYINPYASIAYNLKIKSGDVIKIKANLMSGSISANIKLNMLVFK